MSRLPARPLLLGLVVSVAAVACSAGNEQRGLACPDRSRVVTLTDIHYPEETCESAVALAENRLQSAFYLKACRQLAPSEPLPSKAVAATVLRCESASTRDGFEGGVVTEIEVCCP